MKTENVLNAISPKWKRACVEMQLKIVRDFQEWVITKGYSYPFEPKQVDGFNLFKE